MKKKSLFLLLIVFLLCGCSNNLTCTKKTGNEISKVKVSFKNNRPITLNYKKTLTYAEGNALIEIDYLDEQAYLNDYNEVSGLDFKLTKKDRQNKIVLNINVDYSLYDISTNFNLPIIYSDKISNTNYLENNGYECK